MIDNEQEFRLSGYNRPGYNYNEARYKLPIMKYYSYLRSVKISCLLRRNLSIEQRNKILDVGCGNGLLLNHLYKMDKHSNFVGLDFSDNMLKHSVISKAGKSRVKLCQGSAFEMPFEDKSFDAVICTRFIHQYSNDLKLDLIKEMRRVLKPNGLLIIEFYSFFPRFLRYLFDSHKISANEYFKHSTSRKELEFLIDSSYKRENLILPHPNLLAKILGTNIFKYLSNVLPKLGFSFLIDQYLIYFRNKQ